MHTIFKILFFSHIIIISAYALEHETEEYSHTWFTDALKVWPDSALPASFFEPDPASDLSAVPVQATTAQPVNSSFLIVYSFQSEASQGEYDQNAAARASNPPSMDRRSRLTKAICSYNANLMDTATFLALNPLVPFEYFSQNLISVSRSIENQLMRLNRLSNPLLEFSLRVLNKLMEALLQRSQSITTLGESDLLKDVLEKLAQTYRNCSAIPSHPLHENLKIFFWENFTCCLEALTAR